MSDAKYSGHTAEEVIELMGMLAAQHDVHSADETLAIVRRGYALIKDQQSRLEACTKELDEREDYELCDTCGNLSTETTDTDDDGSPLGHVQCAQCSRMASLEHDLSVARQSLYEVVEQRNNAMSRLGAIRQKCAHEVAITPYNATAFEKGRVDFAEAISAMFVEKQT